MEEIFEMEEKKEMEEMYEKEEILSLLKEIEEEYNIEILYAVESGSRAWGLSNEESDYDIRFIFKHSIKDYLSLKNPRDAIDRTIGDYDIVGWDIKKALKLHMKDNPNLREWIKTPIVYYGSPDFLMDLPEFDFAVLKFHYGSIAYNIWKDVLNKSEMDRKTAKNYLYCIRCILAWICADMDKDSSIKIADLMEDSEIDDDTKKDILEFINNYRSLSIENISEDTINRLSIWIDDHMDKIHGNYPKKEKKDPNIYDKKLFEILGVE